MQVAPRNKDNRLLLFTAHFAAIIIESRRGLSSSMGLTLAGHNAKDMMGKLEAE